jgi:hypothetical protein
VAPEDKDELIEGVDEDCAIDRTARQLAHYSGRNEITAEEREIVTKLVQLIFMGTKMAVHLVNVAKKSTAAVAIAAQEQGKLHDVFLKRLSGITRTNSKRRAAANADYQRYRAMDAELGNGKLKLHQRALRVQAKLKERGERVASCRTIERALIRPKGA